MKHYAYFFTRQDMIPEQIAVQTAHAAMVMGSTYDKSEVNPHETYFTLIGVRNLRALLAVEMILEKFEYAYEAFYESDMNGEMTCIAVHPISEYNKGPLEAFNRLKI